MAAFLAVLATSLAPTALNVAERTGTAVLQGAPVSSQESGVRFEDLDDFYRGEHVSTTRLAVQGEQVARRFEGIAVPAPGELVLSPAARKLRESQPEFAERYPGTVVDEIPRSHLPGPRSVSVWQGVEPATLPPDAGWLVRNPARNADLRSTLPQAVSMGYIVILLGFILPLLALTVVVSSLGARRREERTQSLMLLGLPGSQARFSGVLEDVMLSVVGTTLGFVLFWLIMPQVSTHLPIAGGVWPQDIELDEAITGTMLVVLPMLSALAAWLGIRGATNSQGAAGNPRRAKSHWLSAALLLAGLLMLGGSWTRAGGPQVASTLLLLSIPATALGLVGLVPTLVRHAAGLLVRGSGPALWGGRLIRSNPARASRVSAGLTLLIVVSGLMLLFFPLLSDVSAASEKRLAETFGGQTLFATSTQGQTTASERRAFQADPDVRAAALVRWRQVPGYAETVYVVDCHRFAAVAGVTREDCRSGMTGRAGTGRLPEGRNIRAGGSGVALKIPQNPVVRREAGALIGYNTDRGIVLPRSAFSSRSALAEWPELYLVRPEDGAVESVRTRLVRQQGAEALTWQEQYQISTFTTRQFRALLWLAAVLVVVVASLSTLVSSYERVRTTRPERRLLAIAGARQSFSTRALRWQTLLPLVIAVPAATALSFVIAMGFVRLQPGGYAEVPVAGILTVALACLVVPCFAANAALALESRQQLLRSPE